MAKSWALPEFVRREAKKWVGVNNYGLTGWI